MTAGNAREPTRSFLGSLLGSSLGSHSETTILDGPQALHVGESCRRNRRPTGSSKLAHLLAVNEFVTRLAAEAAEAGGGLREWWGERRAAAAFGGVLAPDGYGRVELAGGSLAFLLELDRGSEPHARLQEKERRYLRELPASNLAGQRLLVLLLVPTLARAARASAGLEGGTLVVQVWTPESGYSPLALLRDAHAIHVCQPDDSDLAPPPAPHA